MINNILWTILFIAILPLFALWIMAKYYEHQDWVRTRIATREHEHAEDVAATQRRVIMALSNPAKTKSACVIPFRKSK